MSKSNLKAALPENNLDMFTSPDNLLGPVDELGIPTTSLVQAHERQIIHHSKSDKIYLTQN